MNNILVLWLLLFVGLLVGGLLLFLLMEWIASLSTKDKLNTLSWYLKKARRRLRFYGYLILFAACFTPPTWLFLHLAEIGGFA